MASIQYQTEVPFDANLKDAGFTSDSLSGTIIGSFVVNGVYITAGAPIVVAGFYAPGALIQNVVDGNVYRNSGTTAAPVWVAI